MNIEETKPERTGKRRYSYTVNQQRFETFDGVQDARKILRISGFDPPDEHVLIEAQHPGTIVVGLDEDVQLDGPKDKEFRAFLSDRTFAFTIDERGYEYGRRHDRRDRVAVSRRCAGGQGAGSRSP